MTLAVSCNHVIIICRLHNWFVTSRVNEGGGNKIVHRNHMGFFCLVTVALNDQRGSEFISPSWDMLSDTALSDYVAGPNCGC